MKLTICDNLIHAQAHIRNSKHECHTCIENMHTILIYHKFHRSQCALAGTRKQDIGSNSNIVKIDAVLSNVQIITELLENVIISFILVEQQIGGLYIYGFNNCFILVYTNVCIF